MRLSGVSVRVSADDTLKRAHSHASMRVCGCAVELRVSARVSADACEFLCVRVPVNVGEGRRGGGGRGRGGWR